jgi:hypothetical protein
VVPQAVERILRAWLAGEATVSLLILGVLWTMLPPVELVLRVHTMLAAWVGVLVLMPASGTVAALLIRRAWALPRAVLSPTR